MNTKQIRDWHAKRKGWTCVRAYYGKDIYHDETWTHPTDNFGFNQLEPGEHPFPDTIDGAASAMPPGWKWCLESLPTNPLHGWYAYRIPKKGCARLVDVAVADTGNEIKDRYALAMKAWQALSVKESPTTMDADSEVAPWNAKSTTK